jgi:hypothetical protein
LRWLIVDLPGVEVTSVYGGTAIDIIGSDAPNTQRLLSATSAALSMRLSQSQCLVRLEHL